MNEVVPVVLCGGAGSRLWPLSRGDRPKQLMPVAHGSTLLTATLERLQGPPYGRPVAVTGARHATTVGQHLSAVGGGHLVVEPMARDTAAAVAVAAAFTVREDPDAVLLVAPADHAVTRPGALREAVRCGVPAAEAGYIVTLGITPRWAATEYGWIRPGPALVEAPGCRGVVSFEEKPDALRAQTLFDQGTAVWNAGMFLVRAQTLRTEIRRFVPEVAQAAERAVGRGTWDRGELRLDAEAFAAAPRISLDHAVMERTGRAAVVATDPGWSDVGDFGALYALAAPDADGNVSVGPVVHQHSTGCYLHAEGVELAVHGVDDMVVVATERGVVVLPRSEAPRVKELVARLRDRRSST